MGLAKCLENDCFDPLDPNGNITIIFDIHKWTDDGYQARVTIQNYYQYRHIEKPGWQLGWTWTMREVIWEISGAYAAQQGNCSNFKDPIPHSCKRDPNILDLPQGTPDNKSGNCCHGGLLAAWAIEPPMSYSSFDIKVGNLGGIFSAYKPANVTLMAPGPGYTCGPFLDADPTVSSDVGGRREIQVFRTWKSTCTYSSFLANKAPVCCVSLSTFYNPDITPCAQCSCGCREADSATSTCIDEDTELVQSISNLNMVKCTDHMCPVRVHWHVKNNYKGQWRVKLTISNYHYWRNFSDWNVLVQHPGFGQSSIVYSFNSTVLSTASYADEVALFWGLPNYNDALLRADDKQLGSVTTEILINKDLHSFTLRNGWAFPRRIYFNGENCEMPLPDTFPMLPNGSYSRKTNGSLSLFLLLLLYITISTLHNWQ
ncbi:COBRA, plant [Dillenia turbinata]|uniref:COBRA-like protein n=1 Tax=Dillenia turbinata TaxID=194707 RepID=A0AAN8UM51_9MAGN